MSQATLTVFAQYTSLAASLATVLTLAAVWFQIQAARRVQAQDAARQLYAGFLAFAAGHPEAVDGDKGQLTFGSRYDWSVYLWLTALESGWLAFGGNDEWKRRVASFARQNGRYLESTLWHNPSRPREDTVRDFDPQFVSAVQQAYQDESVDR